MAQRRKTRLKHLAEKVRKGERIIGMECHDTPSAIMAEELGMDLLCCGSPGPMGMMGHKSMATVDFEEQLYMLEGVLRGASSPFIICNMPNTTASISIERSVRNAAKVVKLGADGVHIEPSLGTVDHIRAIVAAGIPVVGHFGVQGERAVMNSGHTPAGRTAEEAAAIVKLVKASIDAGIFAALFEHTSVELTKWCYENLPVAVASLGSGPHAHGIFHVSSDIIGCSAFPTPPKREVFGDVWGEMKKAYGAYFAAAKGGQFPNPDLSHEMHAGEFEQFLAKVD
jgi:3-methyl-2-oxobutanoate hydroxymethyltransferase